MSNKYAIVTAVSSFRIRYVVPMDALQNENKHCEVNEDWACDMVVVNEVEEFSQEWLGEYIVDVRQAEQQEVLELFDKENDYASSWTEDYKLQHIHDWKVST